MTEQTNSAEQFAMPVKTVPFTFNFKKVSKAKKADEFAMLVQAAEQFPHVKVEHGEVKNEAGEVTDTFVKRVSETYAVVVPNFEELLQSITLDEEGNLQMVGVTLKEFKKLQEDVESSVFSFAKGLIDGSAAKDEDDNFLLVDGKFKLEGFAIPTAENCSYAILAAIERVRGGAGAGRGDTIPTEIRDAALASLQDYLAAVGVPDAGQQLYAKIAKTYFSRNVAAQLQPEAIERIAQRIAAWYEQLDEDDKATFAAYHARVQSKAQDLLKPQEVDMGIL